MMIRPTIFITGLAVTLWVTLAADAARALNRTIALVLGAMS
jgi:hypothetical protein